jgi:3-deoxy-D-manno-octulosonic-acid transferase
MAPFSAGSLMLFLYSLVLYLMMPFVLLRLWFKGRRLPAYRERILERLCWDHGPKKPVDVWVHAVSLGEVIAATPLIDGMLDAGWRVLITTMTPTGSGQVKARFGHQVQHQYLPYDLGSVIKRFFNQYTPRVGVIVETEIWPNLIHQAGVVGVPLLLANARLSEQSAKGYRRLNFFFKPVLNQFAAILAQSEGDAQHFRMLGAEEEKVIVLGNMKFDIQTQGIDALKLQELKHAWGKDRTVLIAASTHANEETLILSRLKRLQSAIPHLVLLIAPRHPERFQAVYQLANQAGFKTGLRSATQTLSPQTDVVILDSLGELLGFYQMSDYAFVGGSLVPVGGHNVLEPIAMNVPVLSGNQVHHFKSICRDLHAADAIQIVNNVDELVSVLINLHQDEELRKNMVKKATEVLERNKGSVLRHLSRVSELVGANP